MDEDRMAREVEVRASVTHRWPIIAAVALFCIATFTLGFALHEWRYAKQLTADNAQMSSALSQTQSQMDALGGRLNALQTELAARTMEQPKVSEAPKPESAASRRVPTRSRAERRRAADPRWKKLQTQLADQQKQLAETRQELTSTRSELEGNLNSTRDQLNGSIARTHDELVALEKKGERSYYEFDLAKSKQFERVGPVSLSLRKVNTKHRNYNVEVLVNDASLSKKNVNLYEPVWFYSDENSQQGLELVVNKIEKDRIHGYVSAPKYKAAELASISGASSGNATAEAPSAPAPDGEPTLERRSQPTK